MRSFFICNHLCCRTNSVVCTYKLPTALKKSACVRYSRLLKIEKSCNTKKFSKIFSVFLSNETFFAVPYPMNIQTLPIFQMFPNISYIWLIMIDEARRIKLKKYIYCLVFDAFNIKIFFLGSNLPLFSLSISDCVLDFV